MPISLTATKIKDTYGQLLHVDGGVTSTLKTVYDGDGTATALKVSTTGLAIETNSSSDAIRITQTGSGNALVVEDSANPDSSPFVITSNGDICRGNTTPLNIASEIDGSQNIVSFENIGSGSLGSSAAIINFTNSTTNARGSFLSFARSNGSAIGSQVAVLDGNELGVIGFQGSDGTNFIRSAKIAAQVDGTPGTNDMPGRLVFSTTADGASAPTERMRIDNAGRVGIGGTAGTDTSFGVYRNITGAVGAIGIRSLQTILNDVTSSAVIFQSVPSTQAAIFTLSTLTHFQATQLTIGAGSTVTNQHGFRVENSLTGATNNYGFYSNIPAATGRYNFYAGGSADNYFAGSVGIGALAAASQRLLVVGSGLTASTFYSIDNQTYIPSTGTAAVYNYRSVLGTAAASFTVANMVHYSATQVALGSGSSATNQVGFSVDASLTGATNNYGFYSNIAAGTGRWNFYAGGTAANYFAGAVGIGGLPVAGTTLVINKNITGAVNAVGVVQNAVIQSDVTGEVSYFSSGAYTQAAAFSLINLRHYNAAQGTIGAGSSVSNQFGYTANGLTGATNNFGFYSNIASGTGRWNFYAAGTADNYFAGRTFFGAVDTSINAGLVNFTSPTAAFSAGIYQPVTISSSTTSNFSYNETFAKTTAASFTLATLKHYVANQGTIGAGSTVTNQYGFLTESSLTGATNNYGFCSAIASGTGRWNFYAAGTADNYFAGNVGVGGFAAMGSGLLSIQKSLTGATSGWAVSATSQVLSDVTTSAGMFSTYPSTQAAAFTLPTLTHFQAAQGTIGAGSTVTNQNGFVANGNLTGATNNYGFISSIASGTGRWNFYAAGTADNYFAGKVGIGVAPNYQLHVNNNSAGTTIARFTDGANSTIDIRMPSVNLGAIDSPINPLAFFVGGSERMRIDSSGNVIQSAPTTAPTLSTNGTMVFNLTSNTNLRVSVRGSDGVTRTANITLA